MKICIIGAGASGIFLAIKLRQKAPNLEIFCLEKNDKIGKKLLATGNGKCNIGNSSVISEHIYRNHSNVKQILAEYDFPKIFSEIESLGIKLKMVDKLCYPNSESASSLVAILKNIAVSSGVNFLLETVFMDYQMLEDGKYEIVTNKEKIIMDKIVFSCGGKSFPQSGTDGKVFDILQRHGYLVSPLYPGLCPIQTIDSTKSISGQRIKGRVSLYEKEKLIYEECGEILFKDDGLSGIVIFNISSIIARRGTNKDYRISLNLFPDENLLNMMKQFIKMNQGDFCFLKGYFHDKIVEYILKRCKLTEKKNYCEKEIMQIAQECVNLSFSFKNLYSYEFSQVTVGGVDFKNVDENLESKREKNIFFIGEILDVDGLCGGFNLMWAQSSALYVADKILKSAK